MGSNSNAIENREARRQQAIKNNDRPRIPNKVVKNQLTRQNLRNNYQKPQNLRKVSYLHQKR